MSPRSQLQVFFAISAALVGGVAACTLTSDSFSPQSVDAPLQPPPAVNANPSASMPVPVLGSGEPEPVCSAGSELLGCEVALSPGTRCDSDLDCSSNACIAGACAAASCEDGRRNAGEADVDCAGPCTARCERGDACTADADCADQLVCPATTQRCTDESCQDGALNGREILTDCGGGVCAGCPVGTSCERGADCSTGVCGAAGTCAPPRCDDGVKNQDESGIDCGGACPNCATGQPCGAGGDCQSGVCSPAGCAADVAGCCQAPRCDDGVRNGNEPVTDCGNANCGPCAPGRRCNANVQCSSRICQGGFCAQPLCADGVRSGSETDIDCGGNDPTCARCGPGDRCSSDGDCASRSCISGACADCGDGSRNGTETGVDCGGVCGPCSPGQACSVDADCQSGACEDGRCCGGNQVDCTRCARRLSGGLNCNSNGPTGAADCNAFLDCLAANADVCPVRYAPGCSDEPGSVCDNRNFGSTLGPGVGLADAILGTASCFF
jgi:hypothetical protein